MKTYLDLLQDVLENGETRMDRTGVGTLSVFGRQIRYDLSHGFPLLTTKKLHIKSILHELLWFLKGETTTHYLKEKGVSIWDEWATEDGNLGPIYGSQWRKWPDGKGGHIDQLAQLMDGLKKRPHGRRHLFHGWNVASLPDETLSPQENAKQGKMALPPCHLLYQFYVHQNNKLSCLLYIRSNDLFLGHPYNTASVAFLTHMIAQQCDMVPGEIIISMGDLHLYKNHIEQARLQLTREPRALPQLNIKRKPPSLFDYAFEDFEIVNYNPHPPISAPIAI
jgi:thymidylate synthase